MLLKNKDVPFCFPLDFFGILIILVFWGKRNLIDSNLTIYESLIDVQKKTEWKLIIITTQKATETLTIGAINDFLSSPEVLENDSQLE